MEKINKAFMRKAHIDDMRFDIYQIYRFKIMLSKTKNGTSQLQIKDVIANIKLHYEELAQEYYRLYHSKPPSIPYLSRSVIKGWRP